MEDKKPKNILGTSLQVKLFILIIALIFVGLAGYFGYYLGKINRDAALVEFGHYQHSFVAPTTTGEIPISTESYYESPTATWKYAILPAGVLDNVIWTSPRMPVASLKLFKFEMGTSTDGNFVNNDADSTTDNVAYNEMGHFVKNGQPGTVLEIKENFACEMGCGYSAVLTAVTYNGNIYLLDKLSTGIVSDEQIFKTKVLVDKKTDLAYLHFPKILKGPNPRQNLTFTPQTNLYENVSAASVFGDDHLDPNNLPSGLKLAFYDQNWGNVYGTFDSDVNGTGIFTTNQFYVLGQDGNAREYIYQPDFLTNDNLPNITWSDGTRNKQTYSYHLHTSCGQSDAVDIASSTLQVGKDLVVIGANSKGDKIYGLTDQNDPMLKDFYDTSYYPDPTQGKISYAEFLKQNPIFFWYDPFGRLFRFKSDKFGPAVECGKPVIYLYPEKITDVSVKIDLSKMTYSEPAYNGGWNVTAEPNGTLTSKSGQVYPYLFWEGIGVGQQRDENRGFVVAKENVHSFLLEKLAKLGLNQKESTDFIGFWEPKMQSAPYYFVTFYGTQDMNKIAPLTINPKPDTVIRILMDYRALQQPIQVKELRLGALERKGFTVVEWGGVLGR